MLVCYMLRKDYTCQIIKPKTNKEYFEYNKGWYNLDRKYSLHDEDKTAYFYIEGNPQPLNCKDDSLEFMDTIIFKSIILQTQGESMSPWGETLLEYIRNPSKLLGLGIVLTIMYYVAQSILSGF